MAPIQNDPYRGLNGAVANELRAAKARRRLSNERIAEVTGIPLVSVNRYMAGKRHINLALLAELSNAVGANPSRILELALRELSVPAVQQDYELQADDDGTSIEAEQEEYDTP